MKQELSGFADFPLHGGRVPAWLAERMTKLGTAISENIVHNYGTSAFLSRLSDPFWFQAFGAVMGMDWHSSGITTSVMGALKRGLTPRANELRHLCLWWPGQAVSQNTKRTSRPCRKRPASTAMSCPYKSAHSANRQQRHRDGFQTIPAQFCSHTEGEWAVVQQRHESPKRVGASISLALRHGPRFRRRSTHRNLGEQHQGTIMNLVDARAARRRKPYWKS